MGGSIRLHPKHGVNPTIPTCFFCGKHKNEIALLGAAYKGEAPMHIGVIDRRPCQECEKLMRMGVMLCSVKDNETDHDNPYRTGKLAVVKTEAAQRIFGASLGTSRFAFVEDTVWAKLGLPDSNVDNTEGLCEYCGEPVNNAEGNRCPKCKTQE